MASFEKYTPNDLIKRNTRYAYVLHRMGIPFYANESKPLDRICKEKGLDIDVVTKALEAPILPFVHQDTLPLSVLSIEVIVAYLRQMHHFFINKQLPFIDELIQHADPYSFSKPGLLDDLRLVMPLFIDDFIHHIHEEEDTLFGYIIQLSRFQKKQHSYSKIIKLMDRFSISEFAIEHAHSDEMKGIRSLTNGYTFGKDACIHEQVLFTELAKLDHDLLVHARIEDQILLPKALHTEHLVRTMLTTHSHLN